MKKSMVITIFLMLTATANAEYGYYGILEMRPVIDDTYFSAYYYAGRGGESDWFDIFDYEIPAGFYGDLSWHHAWAYSAITNGTESHLLLDDARLPDDSVDVYHIQLGFYGQPTTGTSKIKAVFYPDSFENLNVYLVSPYLKYGRVMCLNGYKEENYFDIPLKNLDPNHIYYYQPYAWLRLHIRPDELESTYDFDMSGAVDLADFRVLAGEWHEEQGCHYADTTGIDGVPDGFVDALDLIEFAQHWLYRPVDWTGDGKVNLKDYALMASHWKRGHQSGEKCTDYAGIGGFPDGITNGYDLAALTRQMRTKK